MIEIAYNSNEYRVVLHAIARSLNVSAEDDVVRIPENLGSGFFAAYNLPEGLSVLVADSFFHRGMIMHRLPSPKQQYFILQFNEALSGDSPHYESANEKYVYNIRKNAVLLTSSLMDTKFILPPKTRMHSIRIIFGNGLLNSLIGNEMADKFLSNYFAMTLKDQNLEVIHTGYRRIIDEMIKEKLEHPLKLKYIYNRTLLLIEKLIIGFLGKLQKNHQVIKLKDDEISRLIKVESLLVKDYSGAPPVIATLSKVAAMSSTKLKKDFKAMYGLPIYEYYQKNRMIRAKALLLEGNYAVKEVGMMVGYSNLGHFAASFKKEFGVLPSEMINEDKQPGLINRGHLAFLQQPFVF